MRMKPWVQSSVEIPVLEFGLEQNEIFIKLELQWKNLQLSHWGCVV